MRQEKRFWQNMMWSFNNYKDNIAVITETNQNITYNTLQQESEKMASVINYRCLIFILCSNQIGSLLGYVTCINNKIVPLLLDENLNQELLLSLIKNYSPKYLWMPTNISDQFTGYCSVYTQYDYTLLKAPYNTEYKLNDELALLLTTSGSTGSPKLVRQSYLNIKSNIESIVQYLELDENERPITTLPMSYTYGLSIINSHLYVGASIVMTQKTLMHKDFWSQFKQNEVTSFAGVPYVYEILDKLRFFKMNLPSLQTMTQAGGKLSPELHKKFAEYAKSTDKRFFVMYGQTEATARMSYLPYDKSFEKYGSMGIAIPGGTFLLIDEDGKEINDIDTVGELVYKGKNVTLGYAECGEDLAKGDERNGVLFTGDMAKKDKDNYYYIVGRKKRFLKIFGSRINLDEVEKLIKENFDDLECVCTGIDDKMNIFITNKNEIQNVLSYIAKQTGFFTGAFSVKFIENIPRNEAGKILFTALEKYYD